jgi:hypothetical protein
MKTKNLIIGAAALILAAGVTASSEMVNPIYIQRVVGFLSTANYRIINQNLCSPPGAVNREVRVTINGEVTTRLAYPSAFPSAGSTTPLKSYGSIQVPSPPVSFP